MKTKEVRKYEYIDALRGIAILGVVLFHSSLITPPNSRIFTLISEQGARGVQLFFIASALTIFMSINSRKNLEEHPITNFYIRRFFRIAPAFYTAIIFYTLYRGMGPNHWAPNGIEWWHIALTFLFSHGWHPETINSVVPGGWSIAVEITFYIFAPAIFSKFDNTKKSAALFIFALLISTIISNYSIPAIFKAYTQEQKYLINSFSFFWFISQLPVFILGSILFHTTNRFREKDKAAGALLLAFSLYLSCAFLETKTLANLLPTHILFGISFFLLALSLHSWPNRMLVNQLTVFTGKLSFSIYLVHFAVIYFIKDNGHELIFFQNKDFELFFIFFLIMSASILISMVTYRFIEKPGINFGNKVIDMLNKKRIAPLR